MIGNTYFINDILGWFTVLEHHGDWLYGLRFSIRKLVFEITKTHMKKEQLNGKVHVNIQDELKKYMESGYPYVHK